MGKQVAAVVELKARFDEQANILWARALEEAGVHVVYGLVGLKTHSKAALVVRREEDGIRRYCHVGTGNYNPRTARQYEDIGLLSADPELGADVGDLFNFLTGFSRYDAVPQARRGADGVAPADHRAHRSRGRRRARGAHHHQGERSHRPRDHRRPVPRLGRPGSPSTSWCAGCAACVPACPGLSENIRVRSIVGPVPRALPDLPLRRDRGPATDACSSGRPTSWSATSTGGSRS